LPTYESPAATGVIDPLVRRGLPIRWARSGLQDAAIEILCRPLGFIDGRSLVRPSWRSSPRPAGTSTAYVRWDMASAHVLRERELRPVCVVHAQR
jgi:hypothetical protein